MQHAVKTFAACLLLAACSQESGELVGPAEPETTSAPDSVVVYSAYADKSYLPALLNAFTQETGLVTIVRNGEMPAIVDEVINKSGDPPADVLITPSAQGVWRVAEEGELRPNYSTHVASNVPQWLQDPDKYWLALSYRPALIVYNADEIDSTALSTYEDLSAGAYRRKLCLSSSENAINRTVIAMLMNKLGRREAELAVRGWVANLAQPPLASEEALVQALARGECAVGIVSSGLTAGTRLATHTPDDLYVGIEGIGITRHARNPEGAALLVDWLLQAEIQQQHAEQNAVMPILSDASGGHDVVQSAGGHEEAAKLAERARYR